jgi:hypothetical protein
MEERWKGWGSVFVREDEKRKAWREVDDLRERCVYI